MNLISLDTPFNYSCVCNAHARSSPCLRESTTYFFFLRSCQVAGPDLGGGFQGLQPPKHSQKLAQPTLVLLVAKWAIWLTFTSCELWSSICWREYKSKTLSSKYTILFILCGVICVKITMTMYTPVHSYAHYNTHVNMHVNIIYTHYNMHIHVIKHACQHVYTLTQLSSQ